MTTNKKQHAGTTPGFAIAIADGTQLESGMLIAENAMGHYLPIGWVSTIAEAREIAQDDLRMRSQEGVPFSPVAYKVWARGLETFVVASQLDASQL